MAADTASLLSHAGELLRTPMGALAATAGLVFVLAALLRKPALAGVVLVAAGTLGAVHYSWTPETSSRAIAEQLEPSGWLRQHVDAATAAARNDTVELPGLADARRLLNSSRIHELPTRAGFPVANDDEWTPARGWGSLHLGARRSGQPGLSFYRHGRQAPGNPLRGYTRAKPLDGASP